MTLGNLAASALLTATTWCAHEPSVPPDEVAWRNSEQPQALFLSETVLNSKPLSELPLSESDRSSLQWKIAFKLHPPAVIPNATGVLAECSSREKGPPLGSAPDATTLAGLITRAPITVVGTIEQVTAGWSTDFGEVAEMALLKVEEVLRDTTSKVETGAILKFLRLGGRITVQGAELCTKRNPDFATPAVGDRYLLIVGPGKNNYVDGLRFPVIDDTVQIQPYSRLSSRESVTVTELRNLQPNQE